MESDTSSIGEEDFISDREIQKAFAEGKLKPGLNVLRAQDDKKKLINNKEGLIQKIKNFELSLPWVEKLDMINEMAVLAPELAQQEDDHKKALEAKVRNKDMNSIEFDDVHNDFRRELCFYRQAQRGVLTGVSELKKLGIKTKRPDDYFAEMAKSDDHMQKVRQTLMSKKAAAELSEKAKALREMKKQGKAVQVEAIKRKHKEKRELMDKIKKYKKKQISSLDFLEDKKTNAKPNKRKQMQKKVGKERKFGFGGQKKRSKYNTSSSAADVGGIKRKKAKRPGKIARNKAKQRKKR